MPRPDHVVPIVPTAVVFDLGAGGDFTNRPDAEFGRRAAAAARPGRVAPGHGRGRHGRPRRCAEGRHRLGQRGHSTSGVTVAALVVLNSGGSPVDPATGELWGARYGLPGEFAELRRPRAAELRRSGRCAWPPRSRNTTLAVVATDAD